MKLDYLKIFERAARMIWERKILWLFGFLSLFGGCGANNFSSNFSSYSFSGSSGGETGALRADQLQRLMTDYLPIVIIVATFLILVGIVLMVIGYVARAGLIYMASGYDAGGAPGAGEGFSRGGHYWLKLLGIDIVLFLPVAVGIFIFAVIAAIIIAVTVPGFASAARGSALSGAVSGGAVCLIFILIGVMILLLIPALIFLGVLQILAHRACVLDDDGVMDSIRTGYRLIKTRFGDVALMWLLRLVIGIAISIVLAIVLLLVIGVPIALMLVNVIIGMIALIPGVLIAMFLSGVIEAFTSAAWTIAYREMTAGEAAVPAATPPPAPAPAT